MAVAWFFVPYERHDLGGTIGRRVALSAYQAQINADGGDWRESECLGDMAVVKIRASAATLTAIAGEPLITHVPLGLLDDPVNTLTSAQQTAVKNRLLALGYTPAQLNAAFPLGFAGPYTLRQVLAFALGRRQKPRYDAVNDAIVLDGPDQPCDPPDVVDAAVANG